VGAWDPYEREGGFVEITGIKPTFPYVLGTDGAGTIAAVGKDVSRFKEGDRVYALEEAAQAQKALAEHHLGKIALRIE
jgi:NADPH:quinone reductase-like Zn-dependent oxidoreductase